MSSKLIHSEKPFVSGMIVDAVLSLDRDELDESLIGVKKIPGGGMQDSLLIRGVFLKRRLFMPVLNSKLNHSPILSSSRSMWSSS